MKSMRTMMILLDNIMSSLMNILMMTLSMMITMVMILWKEIMSKVIKYFVNVSI